MMIVKGFYKLDTYLSRLLSKNLLMFMFMLMLRYVNKLYMIDMFDPHAVKIIS